MILQIAIEYYIQVININVDSKRMGQRTVPWETPDVTGMLQDFSPSGTISCVCLLRKSDLLCWRSYRIFDSSRCFMRLLA